MDRGISIEEMLESAREVSSWMRVPDPLWRRLTGTDWITVYYGKNKPRNCYFLSWGVHGNSTQGHTGNMFSITPKEYPILKVDDEDAKHLYEIADNAYSQQRILGIIPHRRNSGQVQGVQKLPLLRRLGL